MSLRIPARFGAFLIFLMSAVLATAQAAPAKRWTFVLLDGFGSESVPFDINDRGDVVGTATVPGTFQMHAFLWQNGVVQNLGPAGSSFSSVGDVTDRGTMLGHVDAKPFLFKDGAATPIPVDGIVMGINKSEDIVGSYRVFVGGFFGFAARAFLIRDGVFHDLGTLGGDNSQAVAINDRGAIAGFSFIAPDSRVGHAFIYENGVMRDLGTLGGLESVARDINNHGVVVGGAQEPGGRFVATAWDRDGARRLLDAPSTAFGINHHGAIIIGAIVGDRSASFLYEDGALTRLDELPEVRAAGITRLQLAAINDRGWITGSAFRANGDFMGRGFVLIPR